MRMSCNGCRILRKGCSDDCTIKPCLDWIKSSDSQANATLFLAKFYGRAGLINLIEAGPQHLRPAIFRSLLYEACGRIVDPISGSAGLLWSGKWFQCQAAVDAVLKGKPIKQNSSSSSYSSSISSTTTTTTTTISSALHQIPPPLKIYDIRHVSKEPISSSDLTTTTTTTKTPRMKRSWNRRPKAPAATDSTGGRAHPGLDSSIWLTPLGNAESSAETVDGSRSLVGLELTLGLISSSNEIVKE
ncbi:LOB domain-containing protein 42-like [Pistacia vera]|uniref:LOB domain-containing protein 42-like n=1 Tax=Pistacia vera TaxID=55513 RepID=UPI001262EE45|nr:LOB domain-containing protein 42-like [Pistacia vera]XP_031269856.1 LOB domain-containing protein 42-like [Pistacia vera]